MVIRQDHRLAGALRLAGIARAHLQSAPGKTRPDRLHHRLVVDHLQPEQFRHGFARDVIRRRPEPAGDEHDFRASERLGQRVANARAAIRHRDLPFEPQPERKERLGKNARMRVEDAAEQQFGAGIEDFDAHRFRFSARIVSPSACTSDQFARASQAHGQLRSGGSTTAQSSIGRVVASARCRSSSG